ncbi:MAG: aminopeptidase [Chloroflexi bacterium]|nr:aminopeptidase [Chloroflexota bacterium]
MVDSRIEKLADVLVNYSVKVKPGDWIFVMGNYISEPLVVEVVKQILRAGGHPNTLLSSDLVSATNLRESREEQLKWISPIDEMIYTKADGMIAISSTQNTRSLSNIDPEKQQIAQFARRHLMESYMTRSASKEFRWVMTQYPTQAYAQEADMGLKEFEDFVYSTMFVDKDDPVKEWYAVHDEQQRLIDWLVGKKEVVVHGANADLKLSIASRTFINADGEHNMPSGEIFTSPIEDSANGWVYFTYPAIRAGREVEGVRLEFKEGKVVKATAEKNEEYLLSQLDIDEGARFLGEFAIGTNYGIKKFTKSILYDEKIGGSFHMAIGSGFPEAGGENNSAVHWDFICDAREDSEILVDGELFYKDGKFQV